MHKNVMRDLIQSDVNTTNTIRDTNMELNTLVADIRNVKVEVNILQDNK